MGGGGEAHNVFLEGPRERTTGEGVTTTSHTPDDPKGSTDYSASCTIIEKREMKISARFRSLLQVA